MDIPTTLPGGPLGTVTGIMLIFFGIMALVFPVLVDNLLVMFFAVFALIVSIELVRSGVSDPGEANACRTLQVLVGVLGILMAVSIIVIPYFITVAAKTLFGFWAILTGAANILSVLSGSSLIERGFNAILGIVLAVAGLLIILAPEIITDFILIHIISLFAIITGFFSIWFARANTPALKNADNAI